MRREEDEVAEGNSRSRDRRTNREPAHGADGPFAAPRSEELDSWWDAGVSLLPAMSGDSMSMLPAFGTGSSPLGEEAGNPEDAGEPGSEIPHGSASSGAAHGPSRSARRSSSRATAPREGRDPIPSGPDSKAPAPPKGKRSPAKGKRSAGTVKGASTVRTVRVVDRGGVSVSKEWTFAFPSGGDRRAPEGKEPGAGRSARRTRQAEQARKRKRSALSWGAVAAAVIGWYAYGAAHDSRSGIPGADASRPDTVLPEISRRLDSLPDSLKDLDPNSPSGARTGDSGLVVPSGEDPARYCAVLDEWTVEVRSWNPDASDSVVLYESEDDPAGGPIVPVLVNVSLSYKGSDPEGASFYEVLLSLVSDSEEEFFWQFPLSGGEDGLYAAERTIIRPGEEIRGSLVFAARPGESYSLKVAGASGTRLIPLEP